MTSIIAAMQDSLLLIESSKSGWKSHESLKGKHPQCVTFDTRNPNHVYCGTFGDGLWKSDDGGQSWDRLRTHTEIVGVGGASNQHIFIITSSLTSLTSPNIRGNSVRSFRLRELVDGMR
jgi:hypothetical protein